LSYRAVTKDTLFGDEQQEEGGEDESKLAAENNSSRDQKRCRRAPSRVCKRKEVLTT
jgi:hypothetical protein